MLALKVLSGLFAAILAMVIGAGYLITEQLADQVRRYPDVFVGMDDASRPQESAGLTFLLVGSDSRAGGATTGSAATEPGYAPGSQRSDMIMLVRIDAGFTTAAAVSIPRDAWVPVPGHGTTKINASYSYGGPPLLVNTVENLTGVRVDHFAIIDFVGFQALTDAVGGIDVNVAAATTFNGLEMDAGRNHLNGEEALNYVRQRVGLPGGDLDRAARHQNALRAFLAKIATGGPMNDPIRSLSFLNELSRWITVDDSLTNEGLRTLGSELQDLRPEGITFLTAPVAGTGWEGEQSVVHLDAARGAQLWDLFNAGKIADYVRANPGSALGPTTP